MPHGWSFLLGGLQLNCFCAAPLPPLATVSAGVPTLVAATQTQILWYPLLSHTFISPAGNPAILTRAQSCGDVNTDTTDTAFVSYDNGSSWALLGPQPAQERLCYEYPPGEPSSAICLPSTNAGLAMQSTAAPGVAVFNGTQWALRSGNLGTVDASVAVTFNFSLAPPLPAGTFMTLFSDGVTAQSRDGRAILIPVMSAAQPLPPSGMSAACKRLIVKLCPGLQVHGPPCHNCTVNHAQQLRAANCPDPAISGRYSYFCDPGKPLPNMIMTSEDGLHFQYVGSVTDPGSLISAAVASGSESAAHSINHALHPTATMPVQLYG